MTDIFVEQLVKRKPSTSVICLRILIWVAAILFVLPLCLTPMGFIMVPLALVAAYFVAKFLLGRLNLEFEYALTNNELDIAMIIGQKKRQEMLSLRAADMEFVAPVCQKYQTEFESKNVKTTYNATSSDSSDNRWFILFRKDGNTCRLIFEPKEQFIDGLERYNPSIVHRNV